MRLPYSPILWRKGFGREACKAMLEYGKYTLELHEVISIIDPLNRASIQLAKKNQFHKVKSAFIFNKNHDIYQSFL
ncbi:GNAT family N-acetyltransferase [Carnobacterium gallinarum]|uniref:GNAT family N-acetyltransferase n=1 Tax=Carnobacterium gallinarum TaxID=2749 RepID=UPI001FE19287|nr:GNAT family N-acetyltransferase [Carnobacterium gallinarum]